MWKFILFLVVAIYAGMMLVTSVVNKIEHKPKQYNVDAKAAGVELKLLTFDITSGYTDPSAITALASYIRDNKYDIVALQEESSIDLLASELIKASYPMFKAETSYTGTKQLGILSKYPITETSSLLPVNGTLIQRARITTSTETIDVFNGLTPQGVPGPGCEGFKSILTYMQPFSAEKILMGNFNMDFNQDYVKVGCPEVAAVSSQFQMSCTGIGSCTGTTRLETGATKNEIHSFILSPKNSGLTLVESHTVSASENSPIGFSPFRPVSATVVIKK